MPKREDNGEVAADASAPKKPKLDGQQKSPDKKSKFGKNTEPGGPKNGKFSKSSKGKKPGGELTEKPEDWNEFKKKKKELKLKRKQGKTAFDIITKAKQLGEKLRCKTLKGGEVERNKLINELHTLLKGQDLYPKFVLAHDTSRIVQWLLKYGSSIVKEQISKELLPVTVSMAKSKYGIHCVKRLLKYGNQETKSEIVKAMYGNAVKLSSHTVAAPVLEYAWVNCASPLQKLHLTQEFFGEMYRNSKDDNVKHLRDVFVVSPDLKAACLGATKANLIKVITKGLLDSGLVQTVLNQYMQECSKEDKAELITQLVPHIVVISNSEDGSRAAMQCIWQGTNKDRKSAIKTLKEHVVALCQHKHGHCTIITILDSIDDTVLLQKLILGEILRSARDLAVDEYGRKVLLWLVAPADSTFFHPTFLKELESGRNASTSKKAVDVRRKEILEHSSNTLLSLVAEDPSFWLKNSSLAFEMFAIIKTGTGDNLKEAYQSIVKSIVDPCWKIKTKEKEKEELGIENAGLHMVLKKLLKHQEGQESNFTSYLVEALDDSILDIWIKINRSCFLMICAWESASSDVRATLKDKLTSKLKLLRRQSTHGSKILLGKFDV